MLGKLTIPKYSNPRNPFVEVIINGTAIKNALVDPRAAINVMTRDIMQQLGINNL